VELHGGTVLAESDGQGRGATFTVRLPLLSVQEPGELATSEGEAAFAGSHLASLPRLDNLRVLVVDDEADAREVLEIMLTQCGATLRTAASSREALKVLAEWRPDVLVSDIGMPGEDGYLLIRTVRALEPKLGGRIPAVALTGYAGPEERLRLMSAGYQMHITKPVELAELAMVVARLGRRTAKGNIA
jgi:CheY-like chemotaxis protein